jgi:hypothetical protein
VCVASRCEMGGCLLLLSTQWTKDIFYSMYNSFFSPLQKTCEESRVDKRSEVKRIQRDRSQQNGRKPRKEDIVRS